MTIFLSVLLCTKSQPAVVLPWLVWLKTQETICVYVCQRLYNHTHSKHMLRTFTQHSDDENLFQWMPRFLLRQSHVLMMHYSLLFHSHSVLFSAHEKRKKSHRQTMSSHASYPPTGPRHLIAAWVQPALKHLMSLSHSRQHPRVLKAVNPFILFRWEVTLSLYFLLFTSHISLCWFINSDNIIIAYAGMAIWTFGWCIMCWWV